MASDLYRDVLKEKDNLMSNPRTRSFGGLTSSDNDYKNYIAGMRPRTKSNTPKSSDSSSANIKSKHSNFVDSAARVSSQPNASNIQSNSSQRSRNRSDSSMDDGEKNKQPKASFKSSSYSELASVPSRKTLDSPTKKANDFDFNSLKQAQSDGKGSVGRLRSMFDKNPEIDNKSVVQLRNGNRAKKDRPHSANFDQLENKPKNKVSGIYDRHSMYVSPLQIDNIIANEKIDSENEETQKSDGIDDKETKIDINSILAPEPEPPEKKENDDVDESMISPREEQIELQKQLEIERMKKTQEEIQIEQRFNIKRRSLRERLSDLANGNEAAPTYVSPTSPNITMETSISKVGPPVPTKPHMKQFKPDKMSTEKNMESNCEVNDNENGPIPSDNESQIDSISVTSMSLEDQNLSKPEGNLKTELDMKQLVSKDLREVEKDLLGKSLREEVVKSDPNFSKPTRKDSESEIDKYKSAVERFDDFINKQDMFLDDEDPLKDFPNDFTPDDNSKLFSNGITPKPPKSKSNDSIATQVSADTKQSKEIKTNKSGAESSSDLMNSILNHMEKSNNDQNGYISLLRSSSESDGTKTNSPQENGTPTLPLMSPEAPPRLSKLQGRTPPASVSSPSPSTNSSPQPVLNEDPFTNKELPPSPLPEPQQRQPRPSSLLLSMTTPSVDVIGDNESESEPEEYDSGFYSVNNSEEFILPPAPVKSNLVKSKHEKRRKVCI